MINRSNRNGNGNHRKKSNGNINLKFGIVADIFKFSDNYIVEKRKVYARKKHKNGDNYVDGDIIVPADAGILGRKTTGSKGAEGVGKGIYPVHAGNFQKDGFSQGKSRVNNPQVFCSRRNSRGNFAFFRAGSFGLNQLKTAYAKKGKEGDCQSYNSHTSNPVGNAAPEVYRAGKLFQVTADGRTRGSKTADTFKNGVCYGRVSAGCKKGDCPEKAHKNPAARNYYVSLAVVNFKA